MALWRVLTVPSESSMVLLRGNDASGGMGIIPTFALLIPKLEMRPSWRHHQALHPHRAWLGSGELRADADLHLHHSQRSMGR